MDKDAMIIHGLSNEEYHFGEKWCDYISSSQLKWYLRSPKHYHYMLSQPPEETEAMKFGSLFHDLMASLAKYKGEWFPARGEWLDAIAIFKPPINESKGKPYGNTSNIYKEAYSKFLLENGSKQIVSAEDAELCMSMAFSLLQTCGSTSEQVRKLLRWGKATEVSYFCEGEDGVKMKVRPDMLTRDKVIDWKTCNLDSLDEDSIARQIIKYRYDVSLSMYQYVLHKVTGKWYRPYLVFISKVDTCDCVICDLSDWCYYFSDDDEPIVGMGVGAMEFQRLLKLHSECLKNNHWPGIEYAITSDNRIMKPSVPWYFEKKYFEE